MTTPQWEVDEHGKRVPAGEPQTECPRCGPDWREKHRKQYLVLAIMRYPRNGGLVCMTRELYPDAKAAGYVW